MAKASGVYYYFIDNSLRANPTGSFGLTVMMKTLKGKTNELITVQNSNYTDLLGYDLEYNPIYYSLGLLLQQVPAIEVMRLNKSVRVDNSYSLDNNGTWTNTHSDNFTSWLQLETNAETAGAKVWFGTDTPGKWGMFGYRLNLTPSVRKQQFNVAPVLAPATYTPYKVSNLGTFNYGGDGSYSDITINASATGAADNRVRFSRMTTFDIIPKDHNAVSTVPYFNRAWEANSDYFYYVLANADSDENYPLVKYYEGAISSITLADMAHDGDHEIQATGFEGTIYAGTTLEFPNGDNIITAADATASSTSATVPIQLVDAVGDDVPAGTSISIDTTLPPDTLQVISDGQSFFHGAGDGTVVPVNVPVPNLQAVGRVRFDSSAGAAIVQMDKVYTDTLTFNDTVGQTFPLRAVNDTQTVDQFSVTVAQTSDPLTSTVRNWTVLEDFPVNICFDPQYQYDKTNPTKEYPYGYYWKDVLLPYGNEGDYQIGFSADVDTDPVAALEGFYYTVGAQANDGTFTTPSWIDLEGGSNGPAQLYADDLNLTLLEEATGEIVLCPGETDVSILNAIAQKCADKNKVDKSLLMDAPAFSKFRDLKDWQAGLYATEHSQLVYRSEYIELSTGQVEVPQSIGLALIYCNMWNQYGHILYPPAGHTYGNISTGSNLLKCDYALYRDELKTNKINYAIVDSIAPCIWECRTRYALFDSDLSVSTAIYILRALKRELMNFLQNFPFRRGDSITLMLMNTGLTSILDRYVSQGHLVNYSLTVGDLEGTTLDIYIDVSVINPIEVINLRVTLVSSS